MIPCLLFLLSAGVSGGEPPKVKDRSAFTEIAGEAGIAHLHQKGEFDPKLANIMPWIASIGASACAEDYDLDGDVDIYVSNSKAGTLNSLYRNDTSGGKIRFTDVAREAGVAHANDASGVTMDAAFGDLDNDGDPDLYIVKWGKNQLFRNDGGRFTDITDSSGTGDRGNGNCVLYFDYDSDGFLDILVCNYFPPVNLTRLETTRMMPDSFEHARNGGPNVLYHNNGDLTFTEVSHHLNLDDRGWSLDAGISDLNNDGLVDIYIANDFGQDRVFLNAGGGVFTDITLQAIRRETSKGMNVDFGDFDNDGFMDSYVTNITTEEYLREGNFLWRNNGDGTFTNVSSTTGTFDGGWGWCARFFDYDGDGDLDILALNGFVSAGKESYWEALATVAVNPAFEPADAAGWPPMGNLSLSGYEPSRLFRNQGDGSFAEVALKEGIGDRYDGRGIVLADLDRDGDLDVFVVNQGQPACLYRNDAGSEQSWLEVELRGTRSNRDGVGARLQATAGALRLTREQNGVNGFSSQSSAWMHFGLGKEKKLDRLTVFWPSGVVQDFRDLEVNRKIVVEERGEPVPREDRLALYFARAKEGRKVAVAKDGPKASPAILELERELRRKPRSAALANKYREKARELGLQERAVGFFRELIQERAGRPVWPALRLQLALALIDRIPLVSNDILLGGSLAKESLMELNEVLSLGPNGEKSFSANYIAGMNHLYWPESLKHAPDALRHFERCRWILEQRKKEGAGSGAGREQSAAQASYEHDLLMAIGDALVKGKDLTRAREEWRKALGRYPGSKDLQGRLRMGDEELQRAVREIRGLSKPIDSSLTVLLHENCLAEREGRLSELRDDRKALGEYRLEAWELEDLDRAVKFLEELSAKGPPSPEIQLALGLLEIERLNAGSGGKEALESAGAHLAEFKKGKPGDWIGPYFAGLLELPEAPARAAEHLEEAARLSLRPGGRPGLYQPLLALGDALFLSGKIEEAREAWKRALGKFPAVDDLKRRLEVSSGEALAAIVKASRDPKTGLTTDLEPLEDLETEMDGLEAALGQRFRRAEADRYRGLVRRSGDTERALRFFRKLVSEGPGRSGPRIQLALALIDRMLDPDQGFVGCGLLSSEALETLGPIARAWPEAWGIQYLTGLIHLNWPARLRHVLLSIEAFDRCLRTGGGLHRVLAFQALGDALVKDKKFPLARKRWQDGQKEFPGNKGLEERLGLTSLMVEGYVDRKRSWKALQDTDLISMVVGNLPDLPEAALPSPKSGGKP